MSIIQDVIFGSYRSCIRQKNGFRIVQSDIISQGYKNRVIKQKVIRNTMQQTPNRYSLDLDNDLDRSVEQEDVGYRRDSGIDQFQYEQEEHHFNQTSHHFNQSAHSHPMGDSQFSSEGVFSYNQDYRMRQSVKSDQEFQLEDISGNADMTDRNTASNKVSLDNQLHDNHVNIKQQSQIKQQETGFESIRIVEKYESPSKLQPHHHDQGQLQQQQIETNQISQTLNHTHEQSLTQTQLSQTLHQSHVQTEDFPIVSEIVNNQNQKQSQQSPTKIIQTPLNLLIQSPKKALIQSPKPFTIQSPIKNKPQSPIKDNKTPQKSQSVLTQQDKDQKLQWSNQSDKSFSPVVDPDLYQTNTIKHLQTTKLQQQQTKNQDQIKQDSTKDKSKILLIKQTIINLKQQQHTTSSIRDWFRPSSKVNQEKITKQYNPNTTQIPSPVKDNDAKEKYRRQMQAEMQGFQTSLNQYQKSNKLSSQSIQQKQRQKANKTHLPQTTTYNLSQTTEDFRMLLKISLEKKKENYLMLKEWDKRRAENMSIHRNMIEMLQNQIDKRIKMSLENFEIYTNFFKEKLKQEQKFTTSPVLNTKYALQNNAISKNIYINCSVILNSLSEENQAKCKKVQNFITLIKNDILKDLVQQHLHQSQRELLKIRQKISTLKNSLKKYNAQTEQKSQQLARLFSQTGNMSIKPMGDFYSTQLDFLRSGSQQILIQKRLGENCLEYYHTALNEEFKRAKVIRQALLTYSKGLKETYNIELEDVGLEQLSKTQEVKLIEEFYSLDDMFDEKTSSMLKTTYNIPQQEDITIRHISEFIQTFEFQNFNNRMLLLKEFSAKYYSSTSSKDSKGTREENCLITITVDFWVHLFFAADKTSTIHKPDISLKITPKELQIRPQKEEFIDIVKKQEKRPSMISYFWETKNQKVYRVKFSSKDTKQQFYDYLKKLLF